MLVEQFGSATVTVIETGLAMTCKQSESFELVPFERSGTELVEMIALEPVAKLAFP